jgi:hypothetical protein
MLIIGVIKNLQLMAAGNCNTFTHSRTLQITSQQHASSLICLHQASLDNGSQQRVLVCIRTHDDRLTTISQPVVTATLRLAIYHQSAKPTDVHVQIIGGRSPCVTSPLTTGWVYHV